MNMWLQLASMIRHACHNIGQFWAVKLAIATLMAGLTSLHSKLLIAFAALVVLDLLSRWASLASKYLSDAGKSAKPSLIECVLAMRAARKAGYISSHEMRCRFFSKMLTYIMLVLGAAAVDWAMRAMQRPEFLVILIVSYLGVTEIISILENMQDAGVDEVKRLRDLIEKEKEKL